MSKTSSQVDPLRSAISLVDSITTTPTTTTITSATSSFPQKTTTHNGQPTWQELMGVGIVMKHVSPLHASRGPTAEVGTTVTCKVIGRMLEGVLPPTTYSSSSSAITTLNAASIPFEKFDCLSVTIDQQDVIPGLELALRHSCKGDHLFVRCAPKFAYGITGRQATALSPEVPPETAVEYEVEVLDHSSGNLSAAPLSHARQCAYDINLRKEAGNRWYSYGDFRRASQSYNKGIKLAEGLLGNTVGPILSSPHSNDDKKEAVDEQGYRDQIFQLWMACLNNCAACKISLKEYRIAKDICTSILEQDPRNIKALLRAGKASLELDEFEECNLCISTVLQIDPNNVVARNEMKRLRLAEKEYNSKSKLMASKMAQKLFSPLVSRSAGETSSSTSSSTTTTTTTTATVGESLSTTATIARVDRTVTSFSSLLLLGTSLLVVLVSLLLAFYLQKSN